MCSLIAQAGTRARPHSTLRSYCLQEKEATACQAKMRWADWQGHTWFSIEHDGLAIGLQPGTRAEDAAADATIWATKALDYEQEVQVKPMPTSTTRPPWKWAPRTRLARHVKIPPATTDHSYPALRLAMRDLMASNAPGPTPIRFDLVLTGHDRARLESTSAFETRIPVNLPGDDTTPLT